VKRTAKAALETGEVVTQSPEETFEFGRWLGRELNGGDVVLLDGCLGAGKTLLAKGIAAGLGIDADEVTSPSFTLVNRHAGRLTLYHIDLYRLPEGPTAAYAVDLDEMLAEQDSVIVIEWAERMKSYPLPPGSLRIEIAGDGEDPRRIILSRA
jgi:tRNA threonylcarbamoyladenosine biosynthesis protein TsaE